MALFPQTAGVGFVSAKFASGGFVCAKHGWQCRWKNSLDSSLSSKGSLQFHAFEHFTDVNAKSNIDSRKSLSNGHLPVFGGA
ncbi:MAG: hypothetical protein R2762_20805 [Bryobacteraceae bacterium]